MFDTVMARMTEMVGELFDPSIPVYYPDDDVDWTRLSSKDCPFFRVRPPQLADASRAGMSAFACYIDVCYPTYREAKREASRLVNFLTRPRDRFPSTSVQPIAYAAKESGYWRVTVGFTQIVKYIPPTEQGG